MNMRSVLAVLTACFFIAACSSGSDPLPQLSGTAAIGAPVDGGTVSIQCAGGAALNTTTSSTGKWSVEISGQTFPCIVKVTGGSIGSLAIHSLALSASNTNVTPLTDLIVAAAVGSDPAAWLTANGSRLASALADAVAALPAATDALLGSLESSGYDIPSGDPFTASFNPTAGDAYDDLLEAISAALASSGLSYADFVEQVATGGGEVDVPLDSVITAAQVAAMPQLNSATVAVSGGVVTMRTNATGANAAGTFVGGGTGNKAVLQLPGMSGMKLSTLKNVEYEVKFVQGARNLGPYFNFIVDLACKLDAPAAGTTIEQIRADRRILVFSAAGLYASNPPGTETFSTVAFTDATPGWYIVGTPLLGMEPNTEPLTGTLTPFDFAQYPDACIVDGVSADGGLFRDAAADAACTANPLAVTAPAICGKSHAGVLISISDSSSRTEREWQIRSVTINARKFTFE